MAKNGIINDTSATHAAEYYEYTTYLGSGVIAMSRSPQEAAETRRRQQVLLRATYNNVHLTVKYISYPKYKSFHF